MTGKPIHAPMKYAAGFTIIEVLIAIAIFSIGFMAVGALQTGALNRVTSSRNKTMAQAALEAQVENLKRIPFYMQDNHDPDDGIDEDGDGNTMFDRSPEFRATGNSPDHFRDMPNTIYRVNWWLGTPSTTDFEGNNVDDRWGGSGNPIKVSIPVRATVTRIGGDPERDALMSVQFVKCWVSNG